CLDADHADQTNYVAVIAAPGTFDHCVDSMVGNCPMLMGITESLIPCVTGCVDEFRNRASKISAGTGLLNRKPCISSQLSNPRRRDCSSVSTPSATTLSFIECASWMMVDTSASPCGPAV